jgi:hypothetical protein
MSACSVFLKGKSSSKTIINKYKKVSSSKENKGFLISQTLQSRKPSAQNSESIQAGN